MTKRNNNERGANRDGDFTPTVPPTQDTSNDHGSRPEDGTVGNADGKNPPGQSHNPEDANNGYECDGNNGVGHGNPAHSACSPSVEEPPTTTVPPTTTTVQQPPKKSEDQPKVVTEEIPTVLVPAVTLAKPEAVTLVPKAPVTPQLANTGLESSLAGIGLLLVFAGACLKKLATR